MHPPRRVLAATAATLLIGLGAAACSSGGDESSGAGGDVAAGSSGGAVDSESADLLTAPREQGGSSADKAVEADPALDLTTRALLKKGTVALRADDVALARFDVQKLVDRYDGEIAERTTEADEEGTEERARLVVRMPAEAYDDAMADLEDLGDGVELISSNGSVEDVTTQVIDTDVRVRLQRRSIERISLLLDRASSIRDVVNIEQQLAQREADLGSLEQQQAFLSDQTALSTITISLERTPDNQEPAVEEKDETGFLAGLAGGWNALTAVTTGLLTAGGAVLPFALVALVLGLPWLVIRRGRPGRTRSAA